MTGPRQNRVTPLGELIADPARGLVYGNRGCLHDATGAIRRRYAGRRWIACRLEFRGWWRGALMQPGRFTELFFLDEATALAAGHRPCALCRHDDYRRFVRIWEERHVGRAGADEIDAQLHEERVASKGQRHHRVRTSDLPDGTFVVHDGAPHLVLGPALLRWSPSGYDGRVVRPSGVVEAITPPSLVALLATGWSGAVPLLHPSAQARLSRTVANG
ncbi:MAG: hypothetical protein ABJB55_03070 [Actinomycetota bacterium]